MQWIGREADAEIEIILGGNVEISSPAGAGALSAMRAAAM
jgi:hypothetical protein